MYIDSTKRINLVSLKNIDIWLSYGSYVFWPLLSHFLTNWAEIFNGSSRDYYLSIDVPVGLCPTGTLMGLGPQNSNKKLTQLADLLGHLLS